MVRDRMKHKGNVKTFRLGLALLAMAMLLTSCTTTGRYNTQKGALAGAGVGALAGQIIGGNTAGTLIGAGSGALIGAVVGNAQDQANQEAVDNAQDTHHRQPEPVVHSQNSPPGKWVTVPGRWQGHHWVPEHRQWVPVTP